MGTSNVTTVLKQKRLGSKRALMVHRTSGLLGWNGGGSNRRSYHSLSSTIPFSNVQSPTLVLLVLPMIPYVIEIQANGRGMCAVSGSRGSLGCSFPTTFSTVERLQQTSSDPRRRARRTGVWRRGKTFKWFDAMMLLQTVKARINLKISLLILHPGFPLPIGRDVTTCSVVPSVMRRLGETNTLV